jgi:hypothetical protein
VVKSEKLFDAICRNPKHVRFNDACRAAEALGFVAKKQVGSSHNAFAKSGVIEQLNFQKKKGGFIPTYQAKQLIKMIEKHGPSAQGKDKSSE